MTCKCNRRDARPAERVVVMNPDSPDQGDDDYYDPNRKYKVVLLGESSVGKSSIVLRLVKGQFSDSSESTIGAAFLSHSVALSGGRTINLDIWDTAGQERFRALAPMYYRGAAAAIIVFDITSSDSFSQAKDWIAQVRANGQSPVFVLVGNKMDLKSEREVREGEAESWAGENGVEVMMETSAKTGQNVPELFVEIAAAVAGE